MRLKIPPAFIALPAALWGFCGAWTLDALSPALSPVEVSIVRELAAVMLAVFLVSIAYAQSLLRKRNSEPQAIEKPPSAAEGESHE